MIDPRHEQTTPHADAPYWARGYDLSVSDPDRDANHDWAKFVLRMIGLGMGLMFAAILIGLCSMVFASEMPRGPFLGGPERVDPYSHSNNSTHLVRDDGRFANSQLKPWFDRLRSSKGLCCSFADGVTIDDPDWRVDHVEKCEAIIFDGKPETPQSGYCVRLDGRWLRVPERALVLEPNRFGPAVLWPYQDASGLPRIRCFLPGAGT